MKREHDAVRTGTVGKIRKLSWYILRNDGVGNLCGYVKLPGNHRLFQRHYDHLPLTAGRVHGGVTYAEQEGAFWVLGFDLAHYCCSVEGWTLDKVEAETVRWATVLVASRFWKRKGAK